MTTAGTGARYRVQPGGEVAGELTVPGDKSISHRALMLGGIAEGETEITGFLAGEDCLATLRALQALGVRIERPEPERVRVSGRGVESLTAAAAPLDMGNAGTAMRLFMGLLAPQTFDSTLIGDESLMRRPMERVSVPLRLMGADIPPPRTVGRRCGFMARRSCERSTTRCRSRARRSNRPCSSPA